MGYINAKTTGLLLSLPLLVALACLLSPSSPPFNSSVTSTPHLRATLVYSEFSDCIPKTNVIETGKVVRVVDGDTIHVFLDGKDFPVRYIGVDTPEVNEPFEHEATRQNFQMVSGREVMLVRDISETDQYGRLLRYVLVDGVFVNYRLVALGYALSVTFPPDVACVGLFREAETAAREAKLGLWGP